MRSAWVRWSPATSRRTTCGCSSTRPGIRSASTWTGSHGIRRRGQRDVRQDGERERRVPVRRRHRRLAPNHVDRTYMARTTYGERIAHGVLVLGYSSTASTKMLERAGAHAVSYGYNRVRFTAPVFFGDTVTVAYTVERVDDDAGK